MIYETLLFDQTLQKLDLVFRCGGINIKSSEKKSNDYIKSRIVYIINFLWLNTDVAGGLYWLIDGIRTGKDFLEITYNAPCMVFCALANIKGLMLIKNEKAIHKLIEILRNLERKAKRKGLSIEEDDLINKEKDFLNNVIKVISWLYVIVDTLFALTPIVIILVKYSNTAKLELILPFLVMYPFDPFQWKVLPFVYLHQVWSGMEYLGTF